MVLNAFSSYCFKRHKSQSLFDRFFVKTHMAIITISNLFNDILFLGQYWLKQLIALSHSLFIDQFLSFKSLAFVFAFGALTTDLLTIPLGSYRPENFWHPCHSKFSAQVHGTREKHICLYDEESAKVATIFHRILTLRILHSLPHYLSRFAYQKD